MIITIEWTDRRQTGIRSIKVHRAASGNGVSPGHGRIHILSRGYNHQPWTAPPPLFQSHPPPPGLFMMTRGLSKYLGAYFAAKRASTSVEPPAAKGTTISIGLVGNFSAAPTVTGMSKNRQSVHTQRKLLVLSHIFPPFD